MPETIAPRPTATDVRPDVVSRYSGFRKEVQGLRAVAVLLVVIYHVFLGRVSGGVDIFLLISAFFMTLSFVRKIESGRPLAIGRYWLHTFKRLLPLATVVILVTVGLLTEFPESSVAQFRWEALASVFYVENWALAASSVDYYAADHSTASPFQHFWSLSVQGQVFLLWPLIFGFAWLVRRRTRISSVPILAVCFGLIFAASMMYSVITTETQQAFAYFDTRARLWEFALGSLIALAIPYLNPPRVLRIILGWVGIVSMVSVGILVDVQGAFPGWIALWPLLSAAAIIVAGNTESRVGFDRFLSWRPVVKLGDAAYALYLVHWPLLVTYLVIMDRPWAGPRSGVALVLVSIVLALMLTALIENPLKAWTWPEQSKRRLALVIIACLAVVSTAVLSWTAVDAHRSAQLEAEAARNNPGAAALAVEDPSGTETDAPLVPIIQGDYPKPSLGEPCPEEMGLSAANQTWCGITIDDPQASQTILVVGNSHTIQWLPAIEDLARSQGWNMVSYIRGNCILGSADDQVRDQAECAEWLSEIDKVIDDADPDLVVTTGTRSLEDGGEDLSPGMVEKLQELSQKTGHLLAIRDNPRFVDAPGLCVQDDRRSAQDCTPPATDITTSPNPLESIAGQNEGISTVDMGDLICPDGMCAPVIGNVIVYWDNNHLTQNYVRSLSPFFVERAEKALTENGLL
ncbi:MULTISPECIES: acyltransferase family protein [Kocuria]|uniref:acyltransferase family protein n=1 Tax=Kocuria TaxID=57493 RepID=UPI0028F0FAEA|nr:acyltransferase family protein [Kocuria carniphila]